MIYKAQASGPGDIIPDLKLEATEPFPSVADHTLADTDHLHRAAAQEITAALWDSLPQGTLDRLMAEMAMRWASNLIVRVPRP